MNKRKIIFSIVAVILIAICGLGYHFHQKIYGKSVLKNGYIFIKSDASKNSVEKVLTPFIKSVDDFNFVSDLKKSQKIKAGKYKLVEGMTNNDLANMLRSGNQSPVKVSFNNQSTLQSLAGRIASQIEADSIALINAFTDRRFLKENRITE